MSKKLIIAVDGPSASGKGTLCDLLSKHFHIHHLNTGALYRCVACNSIKKGIDLNDEAAVIEVAKSIDLKDLDDPNLFTEEMGSKAAIVAKIQPVRDLLLKYQRDFANQDGGAILDGRDIGTVICPDAPYKFFITASSEERAKRRYKEMLEKNQSCNYDEILQKVKDRDEKDMNRESSPFKKADDAIEIDTTGKSIQEVFNEVLSYITN